jgi:integrase
MLVSAMTLRHCGKKVTPHLFRHSLAFAWLKSHHGDYLTLSKILWHSGSEVTLNFYATRYNESCGATAMDGWSELRKK